MSIFILYVWLEGLFLGALGLRETLRNVFSAQELVCVCVYIYININIHFSMADT